MSTSRRMKRVVTNLTPLIVTLLNVLVVNVEAAPGEGSIFGGEDKEKYRG